MTTHFLAGIDIGQTTDPSALAVLEKTGHRDQAVYSVVHLQRFELSTPYGDVVTETLKLMATPPLIGAPLAIDHTGVGKAVFQMFQRRRIEGNGPFYRILITAGHLASKDEDGNHLVPKKDLVAVLKVLFQSGRIKIAKELKHAALLAKELPNFNAKITLAAGADIESWRERPHDDLVLAVAMAAWLGNEGYGEYGEMLGFTDGNHINVLDAPEGVFNNFPGPTPWD